MTEKRRYEEADNAFYLKYKSLEDMLKIIIYSAQSMLGTVPMLYHIIHNDRQILFIQTAGGVAGGSSVIIHYTIQSDKPNKKFIELKRLSGEFSYVDKIGSDSMSLYVPVLELEASNFNFP